MYSSFRRPPPPLESHPPQPVVSVSAHGASIPMRPPVAFAVQQQVPTRPPPPTTTSNSASSPVLHRAATSTASSLPPQPRRVESYRPLASSPPSQPPPPPPGPPVQPAAAVPQPPARSSSVDSPGPTVPAIRVTEPSGIEHPPTDGVSSPSRRSLRRSATFSSSTSRSPPLQSGPPTTVMKPTARQQHSSVGEDKRTDEIRTLQLINDALEVELTKLLKRSTFVRDHIVGHAHAEVRGLRRDLATIRTRLSEWHRDTREWMQRMHEEAAGIIAADATRVLAQSAEADHAANNVLGLQRRLESSEAARSAMAAELRTMHTQFEARTSQLKEAHRERVETMELQLRVLSDVNSGGATATRGQEAKHEAGHCPPMLAPPPLQEGRRISDVSSIVPQHRPATATPLLVDERAGARAESQREVAGKPSNCRPSLRKNTFDEDEETDGIPVVAHMHVVDQWHRAVESSDLPAVCGSVDDENADCGGGGTGGEPSKRFPNSAIIAAPPAPANVLLQRRERDRQSAATDTARWAQLQLVARQQQQQQQRHQRSRRGTPTTHAVTSSARPPTRDLSGTRLARSLRRAGESPVPFVRVQHAVLVDPDGHVHTSGVCTEAPDRRGNRPWH